MNPTDVVAAIIKKGDHFLLAKRSKEKYMGLKWEFPGGKVSKMKPLRMPYLERFLKSSMSI